MHLEDALRYREIRRADLYRQFEQTTFSPPPIPVVAPVQRRTLTSVSIAGPYGSHTCS
jgi:hypothetical protein